MFTLSDLKRIVGDAAGMDLSLDMNDSSLDATFTELGFDSLAVLEVSMLLEEELGVTIPDSALGRMRTPRDAIDYVNAMLSSAT